MITIVVAAPSPEARARLEAVLKPRPDVVVLAAAPGAPLRAQVEDARADVVLLALDDQALRRALRDLSSWETRLPIVALVDDVRAFRPAEAMRAGVRGVLAHDASGAEIGAAIEAVTAGLLVLDPESMATGSGTAAGSPRPSADALRAPLTPREVEVLRMMADGLPNKLIAAGLGISGHTVKFHVAAIFAKLGAGSRTEAVTLALRQGLIIV
jgi:NarL family two-component system response regulator YdfI